MILAPPAGDAFNFSAASPSSLPKRHSTEETPRTNLSHNSRGPAILPHRRLLLRHDIRSVHNQIPPVPPASPKKRVPSLDDRIAILSGSMCFHPGHALVPSSGRGHRRRRQFLVCYVLRGWTWDVSHRSRTSLCPSCRW